MNGESSIKVGHVSAARDSIAGNRFTPVSSSIFVSDAKEDIYSSSPVSDNTFVRKDFHKHGGRASNSAETEASSLDANPFVQFDKQGKSRTQRGREVTPRTNMALSGNPFLQLDATKKALQPRSKCPTRIGSTTTTSRKNEKSILEDQNDGGALDGFWGFEGEVCVIVNGKFINMIGGTIGEIVVCNRIDREFTLKNFHDGLIYTACWNLDASEIEWLTPTRGVWTRQQDAACAGPRNHQAPSPPPREKGLCRGDWWRAVRSCGLFGEP